MNKEDIIRMAREAGFTEHNGFCEVIVRHSSGSWVGVKEELERFAALVAAAERNSWPAEMEAMERQVNILTDALAQAKAEEREACALVCDELQDVPATEPRHCAEGIRARGQNEQ